MNSFFRLKDALGFLIIILLLSITDLSAQLQPLSRNDQASVEAGMRAYETAINDKNYMEASRHLNDLAYLYWEHNDYKKAIEYYELSHELNEQLGNENGLAMIQNNLGMLYSDVGEYKKALEYFNKTLAARRSFKNEEGIIAALKNISVVQNNLGMYDQSLEVLQEALISARKTNDPEQIASCYMMLSETYEKAGDMANRKQYYELYQTFYSMKQKKDLEKFKNLADEEAILKQIAEIQSRKKEEELQKLNNELGRASQELNRFDAEKVEMSDALTKTQLQVQFLETTQENERLLNEEESRKARALRNILLVSALSLALISFFVYRNYKQEKRAKKLLAEKNELISTQNTELEDLNKIIAKHNDRMQTELNVGREIQMSMIPSVFPTIPGIELYAALEPALEVGGDLYDFFSIDAKHFVFGVGDVSEKGVPAALFMAVTKTLVKTNAGYTLSPGRIMTEVNKELCTNNDSSMFVTYFLCVLDVETGILTYCNAGHNPPLYISLNKEIQKIDDLHGPVLGALDDYEYKEGRLTMIAGDQITVYTDGVTEAMDKDNTQYSIERLEHVLNTVRTNDAQDCINAVISDISTFRGSAAQSDDITILLLKYTGVS